MSTLFKTTPRWLLNVKHFIKCWYFQSKLAIWTLFNSCRLKKIKKFYLNWKHSKVCRFNWFFAQFLSVFCYNWPFAFFFPLKLTHFWHFNKKIGNCLIIIKKRSNLVDFNWKLLDYNKKDQIWLILIENCLIAIKNWHCHLIRVQIVVKIRIVD